MATVDDRQMVETLREGTSLWIYGRPRGNKADHTQVRFWSTDIEADVAHLAARGVDFDEYDTETFKTINHIVTTAGIGRSNPTQVPPRQSLADRQPAHRSSEGSVRTMTYRRAC